MSATLERPASTAGQLPRFTLGLQVAEWMEEHLVHGPGDISGDPYRLTADGLRFLCHAYALDQGGRRLYRRATYSRRKGFAKSELAAAVAAAELMGPVRFGGWDADGEPVGVPVRSPIIPMAATSEDQAEATLYGTFREMVAAKLGDLLDIGLERTLLADGSGKVQLVSSSSASRDGGKETFVPLDETHLWHTPELKRLHAVFRRNLAKRRAAEPWMLETTTAYQPGQESVAEGSLEYGLKVLSGERKDASLYFDHLAASFDHDLTTEDGLLAAIVEASGTAIDFTNVAAIVDEFHDPQVDEADFRRYWLNQVVKASAQWFDPDLWAARARPGVELEAGDLVALGFDGSRHSDATALVACRLSDGHIEPLGVWEQPETGSWTVPVAEVTGKVREAFGRFRVVRMYADPPYWETPVEEWALEFGAEVVVEWPTYRPRPMSAALGRFKTDAQTEGRMSHNGDAVLARHIANARKSQRGELVLIQKEHPKSPRKIDAAMAAVLAYECRCDAVAAGLDKPKSKRAWFV